MRQLKASRGLWLRNTPVALLEVSENYEYLINLFLSGNELTEKNFAKISGSKLSCGCPAPSPTSIRIISVRRYQTTDFMMMSMPLISRADNASRTTWIL